MLLFALLIFFGIIPPIFTYLFVLLPIVFGTILFTLKIEVILFLFKSWDFWYMNFNGIAYGIELCFLFPDHRMVLGICGTLNVLFSSFLDAFPLSLRSQFFMTSISAAFYCLTLLIGIHYSLFPNINDYQFQFYSTKWNIRQMFETTLFTFVIYYCRYTCFAYFFPKAALFLKLNVTRLN